MGIGFRRGWDARQAGLMDGNSPPFGATVAQTLAQDRRNERA
jgi:hypothetical protein